MKRQQADAMGHAYKIFLDIGKGLTKITKRDYYYFEEYKTKDAKAVIVVLNSTAGTTKTVIDKMRKEGKKVGLLKIRLFRPFPYKEIANALKNIKVVAVLDRSASFGAYAPVYKEIRNAVYDSPKKPKLQSCIFGLGGRDISEEDIEKLFSDLLKNKITEKVRYIGLRE